MSETHPISVRLNKPLYTAATRAAKSKRLSMADYVRSLISEATGVPAGDYAIGLAGADPETVRRVTSAGGVGKSRQKKR